MNEVFRLGADNFVESAVSDSHQVYDLVVSWSTLCSRSRARVPDVSGAWGSDDISGATGDIARFAVPAERRTAPELQSRRHDENRLSTMIRRLPDEIAAELFDEAMTSEQAARLIQPSDDVDAIRAEVRRIAKANGIRIRTGIVGDNALAVIRLDAKLWNESTAVMKEKLNPSR